MGKITIIVPNTPVGQPRARATVRGHRAAMYDVRTIKNMDGSTKPHPIVMFKAMVREMTAKAYTGPPLDGPMDVEIIAVFPRPAGRPKWIKKGSPYWDDWKAGNALPHTSKPDRDNTEKAVLDAMKGIIFIDDKQVCDGCVTKRIASSMDQPHVKITVTFD